MRFAKKQIAAALALGVAALLGAGAPLQACEGHARHSGIASGAAISKGALILSGWKTHRASLQSLPAAGVADPKDDPRKK